MATVRIATESDIPQMVSLLALLFGQEAEFAPDPSKQERGLKAILADANIGRLIVAEDGDRLVGMVNLLYTVSTALGTRVALLEDMIVEPGVRSKGIGQALVKNLAEMCRRDGVKRITLLTDHDNFKAHKFYSNCGFTRSDMLAFRKSL
ncbi:MAG: GNAT family N-acetyltransferase [Rhodobacteraceae bacterium]|nr:GNAT family N-acetyltransferase [Paracoccaceae bacterium]